MSHSFIGTAADETLLASPPAAVKVIPSVEVTQFSSSFQLLPSNNSESTAAKTYSWYCGNCLAEKQVWIQWSAQPQQGQVFAHKVQWCPWDSTTDADWVEDTSIGEVDLASQANTTRVLIPIARYGAYLRLKVWQTGSQSATMDAYGMGKWS